ncbi:hypothetical protein HRS9139_01233 [Pyrenophora teres f. teres]|nr:hypothetical protein HRS9139_01233 [Pyrenophora teres f. teres]
MVATIGFGDNNAGFQAGIVNGAVSATFHLPPDNVDDARFLLDRPDTNSKVASKPLREYIPYCGHGSVLVTTRNREAALELVEQRDIVFVEPMDEASAVALFERKLKTPGDSNKVIELVATLEYMPLAIVQAAAYILQRASRCSVTKYLEEFKKSKRHKTSLLKYNSSQPRRDWEASNSIIVTWEISFKYLRHNNPSAADLLSLMSFFDRQGIPEHVLRSRGEQEAESQDDASESSVSDSELVDDKFEYDIAALRDFCFISDEISGATFRMHALVQLATRTWLESKGEHERWKQQFITNLSAAFPRGKYENWAVCEPLFAHAKVAATLKPRDNVSRIEWATLLYKMAEHAWTKGNVDVTRKMAVKSVETLSQILGPEHMHTLKAMTIVAHGHRLEGQLEEAAEVDLQTMVIRKRTLGANNFSTLASQNNLANTYNSLGRHEDAEELLVQVLDAYQNTLGEDHSNTLISKGNLASTYRKQGRWEDAEKLEREVMAHFETTLGAEHPHTLISMASLASTYMSQGRWKDAEALELKVLETRKTTLGVGHLHTISSMSSLASIYRSQDRWKDAEGLELKVLEWRKTNLGAEHRYTLNCMDNLASIYWSLGRPDEAQKLEVQVMETRKTELGADHPDTLTSMAKLALT